VLGDILTSIKRINLTSAIGRTPSAIDLVHYGALMKEAKSIRRDRAFRSLLENVQGGNSIDLFQDPVPKCMSSLAAITSAPAAWWS